MAKNISSILRLPILCLAFTMSFLSSQVHAATKVIANWDIVPFQMINAVTNVGVVAFHETGVNVEFRVNGVVAARIDDPTYNPQTNVYEYWFSLNPAKYPDGQLTISATAYPDDPGHTLRELSDIILYANSQGTLTNTKVVWADCQNGSDASGDGTEMNPYQTLEKAYTVVGAGGTVYLKRGDCYVANSVIPGSKNYRYWTTVTHAPGLSRSDVKILGGRFGENMVRWHDVQIFKDAPPGYSTIFYFESNHQVWFDRAELFDARGIWNGGSLFGGNSGYQVFITDSLIRDIMNAKGSFLRNVEIRNIGSDVYAASDNLTGINVTVRRIDPDATGAHPDFIQYYNPGKVVDNVILYNNKVYDMTAQGIFGADAQNAAFVNLLMEKDPPESALISQLGSVWDHILLWHVTTVDSGMIFTGDLSDKRNFNVQNCVLSSLNAGAATSIQDSTIDYNHYAGLAWNQTNGGMGSNFTLGDPLFLSVGNDDYRLSDNSPAKHAGVPLPGVPADINNRLYDPVHPSKGAFEYYADAFMYGDVSEDSEISAFDAALAAHIAVDLEHPDIKNRAAAEVSGDAEVSAYDAALIAQRAVGLIEKFPVEG